MHPLSHSRHTIAWKEDITESGVSLTDKVNKGQKSANFEGWQRTLEAEQGENIQHPGDPCLTTLRLYMRDIILIVFVAF